jgi:hypothetical protein
MNRRTIPAGALVVVVPLLLLALPAAAKPVPLHIYTPQMTNDMRNAIDATSALEKELLPHFERLRKQKEDYDGTCGSGSTDENCQSKFGQMTDTYADILAMLEDGLAVLVERIEAASRSYNGQFGQVAKLRPSDLFDEIAGTHRSDLLPARSATGRLRRPLSARIRTYLRLIGETGVSQAEQFIHSAADLSETVDLSRQLLDVVRYQRIGFDAASMLPADFQRQYEGLMPGVASLILGEEVVIPPADDLPPEPARAHDWAERRIDY